MVEPSNSMDEIEVDKHHSRFEHKKNRKLLITKKVDSKYKQTVAAPNYEIGASIVPAPALSLPSATSSVHIIYS